MLIALIGRMPRRKPWHAPLLRYEAGCQDNQSPVKRCRRGVRLSPRGGGRAVGDKHEPVSDPGLVKLIESGALLQKYPRL